MPRARNIKPGFFKNEDLIELPFEARLLFIGLWTLADREGRLEDRPKRIKIELFPGDNCNVDDLLQQLADKKLIIRYEVNGRRYISIPKFKKHQNPHVKEQASEIPPPDEHHTSTVHAPDNNHTSPADSLLLNPDSLVPRKDNSGMRPESDPPENNKEIKQKIKECVSHIKDLKDKKIKHGSERCPEPHPAYCLIKHYARLPPEDKLPELVDIYLQLFPGQRKKHGVGAAAKANEIFGEISEYPTCFSEEEILKEIVYSEKSSLTPFDIKNTFKDHSALQNSYAKLRYDIDKAAEEGSFNANAMQP